MSLGIAFKGPEGIVLAADSRVTLTAQVPGQKELSAFYDNATKLLRVNGQDFVGTVTYGVGAFGTPPRTAHSYVPEFENELAAAEVGRLTVEAFAERLGVFYKKQWVDNGMPPTAHPDDPNQMVFIIGGFNPSEAYGRVYEVRIPSLPAPAEQSKDDFGLTLGGMPEVVFRLLQGFDPSIINHAKDILGLDDTQVAKLAADLPLRVGTPIPYPFLPLQDGVDLAVFLIRTTTVLQRFMVALRGVGGAIDVATVTRSEGFEAIQQKRVVGERDHI